MQTIAQAWLVYRLTGSAALLGLVAFSGQISIFVLAPVSGVVADSKSRKHILFATQAAPMVLSFLLAALTLSGRVAVWHVFTVAALMGVVNAFDFPVRQAFVAELVPKEDLISAVTLNSSMINSARTIGPGIGGLLVAGVGEGWCFLGNALSFVAVIIGLLLMKSTTARKKPPQHFRAGVAEAFNFVRHTGPVGANDHADLPRRLRELGTLESAIAAAVRCSALILFMASHGMGRRLSQGKTGSRTCLGPAWDFQAARICQPRCGLRRRTHAQGGL